jgi:parallel beta helix pectate lyase-like protein
VKAIALYAMFTLIIVTVPVTAQVLEVGPGLNYATVEAAARDAAPGDTILVAEGTHAGGEHISNLQGSPNGWISIVAELPGSTIYQGGSNAWQFSDAAYVRISGFVFQGQTGNGVNIDDAGTIDTPTHHIVIEDCEWRALNATGNNDQLKLSGLDSFTVRNCSFVNGSPGGSGIDMVGCHDGTIENSSFVNQGSNSIQAKGGTSSILIQRNSFLNGGQRGINIGGSTGLQFFRPQGVKYEASNIAVHSNVFEGATAAIAYVGAVFCDVTNNTIINPEKWVIRILQETTEPGFLPCGNNKFVNNIVYLDSRAENPSVNIGPNTASDKFKFENNLWYNADDNNWNGPNLPTTEVDGLLNLDPLFADFANSDYSITGSSPAIGAGKDVDRPLQDNEGFAYSIPRSIGAFEGNRNPNSAHRIKASAPLSVRVFPNPISNSGFVVLEPSAAVEASVNLYNLAGTRIETIHEGRIESMMLIPLSTRSLRSRGMYFINVQTGATTITTPFIVQ